MVIAAYSFVKNKFLHYQFIRFCVVGMAAFIIDAGLLYSLTEFAGTYYLVSSVISVIVATTFSFIANKKWTFRNTNPRITQQYVIFVIVSATAILINTAVMYISVETIGVHYLIGKIISAIIVLFWNFFMNKFVTFGKA